MIYTEYTKLTECILHVVGNKSEDEGLYLSEETISLDEETSQILQKYLLGQVTTDGYSQFWHESQLELNDVYTFAKQVFNDDAAFVQMRSGELCVVYFKNIIVDTVTCDAIGLFKSENKDTFLRVEMDGGQSSILSEKGININKIDKAAIIFNTSEETGYWVTVVDRTNKATEAKYWTDDFLKVRPCSNSYNQTESLLAMTRTFVSHLPEGGGKKDKALMVHRSMEAVKAPMVRVEDYARDVFKDEEMARQFEEYTRKKADDEGLALDDEIKISQQAVKKKTTTKLTTIKLDDNFDIRVHGGEQLVEQGYDEERGMKYYKLYYREEK